MLKKIFYFTVLFCSLRLAVAQEITSFVQFNGKYDYTAIGNTLNPFENNLNSNFCNLLDSSSATLAMEPNLEITAAYLFWAGSGLGDNQVTLNNVDFEADYTYNVYFDETSTSSLPYFSCVKDITPFIIEQGNTEYTLTNLDVSETLNNNPRYCINRTNFAGWSIYIIYKDNNLPLNQVNLFVGLDIINRFVNNKSITIDNLNVLDNEGAKIGFLAWEGDNSLNYGESLTINGNILSSPPLNNANNAFNGTNSFTNSNEFYNVDLDVYDIENNINIGDTEANITLTTGGFDIFGTFRADLIILNNIITVLNSQVPDASVILDLYSQTCNTNTIEINFTVNNANSTELLPTNTPIAIFADNTLIGQTETTAPIQIDGSESFSMTLSLPNSISNNYNLTISVDDDGNGNGVVSEISETNNTSVTSQIKLPEPNILMFNMVKDCDVNQGLFLNFDLTSVLDNELYDNYLSFTFYESLDDLTLQEDAIITPEDYTVNNTPNTVFVLCETNTCYDILEITLNAENCPPIVPQGISPNGDGLNDILNITTLNNIQNYHINIFNRYGILVFKGSELSPWNGTSNQGINKNKKLPTGTYFYLLNSKNQDFNQQSGYIYLTN